MVSHSAAPEWKGEECGTTAGEGHAPEEWPGFGEFFWAMNILLQPEGCVHFSYLDSPAFCNPKDGLVASFYASAPPFYLKTPTCISQF